MNFIKPLIPLKFWLVTLAPGIGIHIIANIEHQSLNTQRSAIVAGFLYDIAWGSLFCLIFLIISTLPYRKYTTPFIFLCFLFINLWSVANLLHAIARV